MPCSHEVHEDEPATEYVPARQLSHSEASSALHLPAAQSEQDVAADAPLYVPAGHGEALAWPVADTEVPLAAGLHEVDPFRGW